MKINRYGIIIAACLWTTISLAYDYETWANAIKNSDITFFAHVQNDDKISKTELMGLLVLANEVVQQQKNDIHDRTIKIKTSIILKTIPFYQIIGFILDQRLLGATLGIASLALGAASSLGGMGHFIEMNQPRLAAACLILGLTATAAVATGCAFLERWFWRRERAAHDQLEKIYHDAIAIKAYLTTLAAKYC